MATREEIVEVYVATFNRAPDADGLKYWISDGTKDTTEFTDIVDIATAMLESTEVKEMYGDPSAEDFNREAFIIKLYDNILNKKVDGTDAGVKYWVKSTDIPNAKMIIALINGAKAETGDPKDSKTLTNKTEVGLKFADAGLNDVDLAKSIMKDVTNDDATVTAAEDKVIQAISTPLTTDKDDLHGTASDDIFSGVVSNLSADKTLNPTDSIDGGDGEDTLYVTLNTNFTGLTGDAKIQNVETINLRNDSTIARNFDTSGIKGVTKYTIDATKATVNLTDMAAKADINLSNQSSGTFTTKFAKGASELTATDDSIKLGLSNVGTVEDKSTTATEEKAVTINLTDIETANVTATGDNVVSFGGTDLTTLNIEGAGNIKLASAPTSLKTVDASAATGKLDINVTNATAMTSITTGSGDDSIAIDAGKVIANASIIGGAGADTITLSDSSGSTTQFSMSSVETLALSNSKATTFSAKNISDLANIQINSATKADTSVVNLGGIDMVVNSIGKTGSQTLTLDNSGTTTINMQASSTNSAAKGTSGALANAEVMDSNITAQNSSNVIINVEKGIKVTGDIEATKATAVTLNVDTLLNKATTPTEQTGFNGNIKAVNATDLTINAKGQVNLDSASSDLSAVQTANINAGDALALNVDLVKAASVTLSGENKESAITLKNLAKDLDSNVNITANGLKAGLKMEDISSKQNLKVDVNSVTGDVSMDALVGANVTLDASTINKISGTTTAATSLTIDSTKADSGIATVNVHDNTSTVDIGTIGKNTSFQTVTVDASANAGTVKIGEIKASDSATVKFAGNLNTSEVGAITAKSVTIDASNALKAVTIGKDDAHNTTDDVTITDSLTYTAGLKGANETNGLEIAIKADTGNSTSTTITLNGNIGNDKFFIDGGNNVDKDASITIKGDLDIGTNSVDVTSGITGTGKATIDLSGLKAAGTTTINVTGTANDDTIKAAATGTTITGGKGADTITAGAGADIIKFEDTGANNGGDTISGLNKDDTLDFGAFLTSATTKTITSTTTGINSYNADSTGNTDINNAIAIFDNGGTALTTTTLVNEFNGSSAFSMTSGGKAVVISGDQTKGTDGQIWYIDDSVGATAGTIEADDIVLVATLKDADPSGVHGL